MSINSRSKNEHQLFCCCCRKLSICSKFFNVFCSSSTNSLFALLFVIVIFCCQTFIVDLMTSFSSQHSSSLKFSIETFDFELDISKSISLATSTQVVELISQSINMITHYVVSMSTSSSSSASHFIDNNVIEFMKRFKK